MPVGLRILRNLDVVFLVCTLPIFIGANLPLLGWAGGSGAYVAQRLISELLNKSAAQAEDVAGFMGVMVGGVIARGFFVALAIFGVGVINGDAGAAAGALFLAAFTIYFTMTLILRPYLKGGPK
jgi:hypothetical protein